MPVPASDQRPVQLDAALAQLGVDHAARRVAGALAHEAPAPAERRRPGGHVRSLPAGAHARAAVRVRVGRDRPVEADDDVQERVPERTHDHAAKL